MSELDPSVKGVAPVVQCKVPGCEGPEKCAFRKWAKNSGLLLPQMKTVGYLELEDVLKMQEFEKSCAAGLKIVVEPGSW
jgi:hypothetical protein